MGFCFRQSCDHVPTPCSDVWHLSSGVFLLLQGNLFLWGWNIFFLACSRLLGLLPKAGHQVPMSLFLGPQLDYVPQLLTLMLGIANDWVLNSGIWTEVLCVTSRWQVLWVLPLLPVWNGKVCILWKPWSFSDGSEDKESGCNAGDWGLIPKSRFPGEGNGYPLLILAWKTSMDGGAWLDV